MTTGANSIHCIGFSAFPAWQVEDIEALVTDVQDHVFGEMRLPPAIVTEVQQPG